MDKNIREIIDTYDGLTSLYRSRTDKTLVLIGKKNSRFLKGVERKANTLNIRTEWLTKFDIHAALDLEAEIGPNKFEVVWDNENKDAEMAFLFMKQGKADLDSIFNSCVRSSCCAKACLEIIRQITKQQSVGAVNITIAGRGHSVKGLERKLSNYGFSSFHINSKSGLHHLERALKDSDILVNASGDINWNKDVPEYITILDVCGNMGKYAGRDNYISMSDIGALNVSILLNRFARGNSRD